MIPEDECHQVPENQKSGESALRDEQTMLGLGSTLPRTSHTTVRVRTLLNGGGSGIKVPGYWYFARRSRYFG